MKCKNCGNILDSNASICFLCGNTDLEPLNNNVVFNNNTNITNETSAEVDNHNNLNVVSNSYNYNDNSNYVYTNNYNNSNINTNVIDDGSSVKPKKKKNIFMYYIILSFILFFGLIGYGFFNLTNLVSNYKEISKEEIKKYMNENGFILNDMTDNYKHLGYIENYYSFKRGSISIVYLNVNGDNSMYNNLKELISVYENNAISKSNISNDNVNKYVLKTRTKYGYIVRVNETIIYTLTDSKYSDFVYSVFDDLGYGDVDYNKVLLSFGGAFAILLLLETISLWKIFVKTGRSGVISLIPIYNLYVLNKIIVGNGLLFLLMFIPIINFIYLIYLYYKLGTMFGKKIGFILGLMFLGYIFIPILACDKSDYLGIKKI